MHVPKKVDEIFRSFVAVLLFFSMLVKSGKIQQALLVFLCLAILLHSPSQVKSHILICDVGMVLSLHSRLLHYVGFSNQGDLTLVQKGDIFMEQSNPAKNHPWFDPFFHTDPQVFDLNIDQHVFLVCSIA